MRITATPSLTAAPAIGVPTSPFPTSQPKIPQHLAPDRPASFSCCVLSLSDSTRPPQAIYRRQRSKNYRDSRSSRSLIPCSAISTTPFGGFGLSQRIRWILEFKPESTDGRREGQANWDEGAYQGESLGSMGTDVTRQRVFSSRTGLRERSGNAGNRVIVTLDAAGCARGAGGREFGGVGSVADSAVRTGAAGRAIGPGRG